MPGMTTMTLRSRAVSRTAPPKTAPSKTDSSRKRSHSRSRSTSRSTSRGRTTAAKKKKATTTTTTRRSRSRSASVTRGGDGGGGGDKRVAYVKSPLTGAWILHGGAAYKRLSAPDRTAADNTLEMRATPRRGAKAPLARPSRAALKQQPIARAQVERVLAHKAASIETLEQTLARTTQPHLQRKLREQLKHKREARGAATRGWASRAPRPGRPRAHLHEQCGDAAFLLPDAEKFPVMAKCGSGLGVCDCKIDCGGVQAAYNRAQQYKYPHVAAAAKRIQREKCG